MAVERHLLLQELTLHPSGECVLSTQGWTVARIADGIGYSLHNGKAGELKVGDAIVATGGSNFIFRASSLGPLKLEYFLVHPQFLNDLLTVAESHQLEQASRNSAHQFI